MHKQHYITTFSVDQSPATVFAAINNVRGWWSGEIEGDTDKLGAVFTYRYQDVHCSTQQITAWVPGQKVVWHVVDSQLRFAQDPREWTGTDVVFEITPQDDKTELRFTHVGLAPALECYGNCSAAWGFYINERLRNLITAGKGQPTS